MRILQTFSKLSLISLILLICVSLKLFEPAFVTTLQLKWFDVYQAAKPRAYEDLPVKIIDIDEASLAKIGQWPWPRTQVAELIVALGEAGAAAIVMDIVFAEPDRTSPVHMQQIWQLNAESMPSGLPDHDDVLAREMAKWPVVVGSILHQTISGESKSKSGFAYVGGNPEQHITEFAGVVPNLPMLEAAAAGNGMLNSDPDADGVLRKVPLLFRIGNRLYPSLAVEALRVAQGAGSLIIKSANVDGDENADAIVAMKIGALEVPTDANGKFWLYYDHSRTARYIPAWQVMAGAVDDASLAGKIVMIGTSAPGLKDLRATPLDASIAGVEVHAQLVEQVLQGISLHRPDWSKGVEVLLVVIAGLFALWMSTRFGAIVSAIGLLSGLLAVGMASWQAFDQYQFLIDPITAWFAMLLVYFAATVWRFAQTERDKSKIRSTFGLYVSKDLVDELAANPDKIKLGGEKKDVTVMFCDIRSFSAISEALEPQQLTHFMNHYLTPMTDIIMQSGGTIDKYMGDAIMAIWNAPLDIENHPEKAALAALAMRSKLAELNAMWAEDPVIASKINLPLAFGIGLNSGECSVGNMGSTQRFEYSVLGHHVDLASRLEGMSKYYGVDIIISERTHGRADDIAAILLDVIRVKGKQEKVRIYAVLADASLNQNERFQDLLAANQSMLEAYWQRDWLVALAHLTECQAITTDIPLHQLDRLYALYAERIETYTNTPPADDWDGAFHADFK